MRPEALPFAPFLLLISTLALAPGAAAAPDPGPMATAPAAVGSAAPDPADSDDEDVAPPTPSAPQPYQPSAIRPFEMNAAVPSAPVPYLPGANDHIPAAPVTVDAYRHSYEGPLDTVEKAYEAGVRRNFNAQQVRMGPLDGAWTVRTQAGTGFMALMLADPGRADAEIEGAWRTLSPRPEAKKSGFLLSVRREGQTLMVRWYPSDDTGNISIMRLNPTRDGRWTGTVTARDVEFPVVMVRAPGAPE